MSCITRQEMRLLDLVMAFRAQHGLPPLRPSTILMDAAQQWSEYIAANDYWPADPHTGPDGSTHNSRARALGYTGSCGGNLLYGQLDADAAFMAWRDSPDHRANMLGRGYGEIGVALAVEPTWDYKGDVFLAASMELGTGSSAPAEVCGTEPKPPVTPIPAPIVSRPGPRPRPVPRTPRVPVVSPPRVDRLRDLIIADVRRRLGLRP